MKKSIAFMLACLFVICAFVGIGLQLQTRTAEASFAFVETGTENIEKQILNTADKTLDDFSLCIFGEASKKFTPDVATIHICVESLDLNKETANLQNQQEFEKLVEALEGAGFKKEEIVFEGTFCNSESCDRFCNENGFRVCTNFSIETSTTNLEKTCKHVSEINAARISHINLSLSNQEEAYQEVLAQALQNAKVKVKNLTQNDNLQIVNIKEEDVYFCKTLYRDFSNFSQDSISFGKIEVQAKVNVTFK